MAEFHYVCVECHRLLMACPRCGRLLHYAAEPHTVNGYYNCQGPLHRDALALDVHPALLACVAARVDRLAREQAEGVEVAS